MAGRADLDTFVVEVRRDHFVTFRMSQRLGQDLVGNAVEAVVDLRLATAARRQLADDREDPTAGQHPDESPCGNRGRSNVVGGRVDRRMDNSYLNYNG